MNTEEKYRSLFEQASDPIMVTDFNGNFVDVNTSLCRMFGYSKEELLTMNISQLIDPIDFKARPIRFDLLAVGQHIFNQRDMIHKDGTVVSVEANVKKFDENTVMAIARDVTEIRKAQKVIQESEARFRAAFEGSAVGIALVSLDGKWFRINKEVTNIIGYTPEELFGMTFYDITHKDDVERDVEHMHKLINGEIDIYRSEKRYIHKNGTMVWANLSVSVIRDMNGKALYFVSHIENITQRKNEEFYREKITKDLLRQNKDLEQFAYIVSHNLRVPIANIMGLSKILKDELTSADETKFCLSQIDHSVGRLDNVITDLSNILQVKRDVSERKEVVLFSELVSEIKSSIENLIQKEDVLIKTDFTSVNEIETIKSYLYSIFYNLISNSIKYRRIEVPPVITVKSECVEGLIRFTYRDNGMGIDLEKHGGQVFGLYKRFYPKVEGKGMGLFMVKNQVETLGGTISVKSEPGNGIEFIIEI